MNKLITLLASLGMTAALAGCTSMDDLTPQVDVGGGTFNSPPVNQTDLDTMSRQTAYPPQATGPVESTPLAAASEQSFAQGPDGTVMAQGDVEYTDPAGSLEAQAGRLREGQAPIQERQVSRHETIADQGAEPGAEPNDTASLDDAAPAKEEAEPLRAAEQPTKAQEPERQAAIAPAAATGTIRFLPIIGAPVEAVTPLSKQLGSEARSHGLTIKSASDPTSQHILKGYFSAFKDSERTTIVYVWDVLDGAGNRLHRIQGQDTVDATAADLWSAVPAQTMQAIGTKTIAQYLEWRANQAG